MKNLLGALALFLAFTVNVSAQEFKKVEEKVEAKLNLSALSEVISLEQGTLKQDLFRLFEYKYKNLNENLSADKKADLAKIIELKLRATLSDDQMKTVEKKEGLLKKLTN